MSASDYLENKILEHIVGKTSFPMPTAYIALCDADPSEAGSGAYISEVPNSGSYARVATAGGDWNAAAGGQIDNANPITFPKATDSWGTVTHFAIMTSSAYNGGHMLTYGELTTPKAIDNGDTAQFDAGDLVLTCT